MYCKNTYLDDVCFGRTWRCQRHPTLGGRSYILVCRSNLMTFKKLSSKAHVAERPIPRQMTWFSSSVISF